MTTLGTLDARAHRGDSIAVVVDNSRMIRPLIQQLADHSLVRDSNRVYVSSGAERIEYAGGGLVSFHSRHARTAARGLSRDLVVIVPPTHLTDELLAEWSPVVFTSPEGRIEVASLNMEGAAA